MITDADLHALDIPETLPNTRELAMNLSVSNKNWLIYVLEQSHASKVRTPVALVGPLPANGASHHMAAIVISANHFFRQQADQRRVQVPVTLKIKQCPSKHGGCAGLH